jgi:hypothetical protein
MDFSVTPAGDNIPLEAGAIKPVKCEAHTRHGGPRVAQCNMQRRQVDALE